MAHRQRIAIALAAAIFAAASARAEDSGFCARLKIQTEAAKAGFKTIRGEFRAGRTASGLLVTRTYSNVKLWDDTACFFGVENGGTVHSCETGFDKDDAAARALRDTLIGDLKACLGKEIKGSPALADTTQHSASLALTGARALQVTVNAKEPDGTDGRILISVRAAAPASQQP
jgi:hypothetical protein